MSELVFAAACYVGMWVLIVWAWHDERRHR